MLKGIFAAAFIVAVPLAVLADEAGGGGCASGLTPESKLIYDESRAALTPETSLDKVVEEKTRGLVHDGKVSMWTARESAETAYACLKKLQS